MGIYIIISIIYLLRKCLTLIKEISWRTRILTQWPSIGSQCTRQVIKTRCFQCHWSYVKMDFYEVKESPDHLKLHTHNFHMYWSLWWILNLAEEILLHSNSDPCLRSRIILHLLTRGILPTSIISLKRLHLLRCEEISRELPKSFSFLSFLARNSRLSERGVSRILGMCLGSFTMNGSTLSWPYITATVRLLWFFTTWYFFVFLGL